MGVGIGGGGKHSGRICALAQKQGRPRAETKVDSNRAWFWLLHQAGDENMKTFPIRIRLAAWYSAILAISLVAFAVVGYLAMRHSVRVTLDAALQQHIEGVRAIIAEDAPQGLGALEDEFQEY